MRKLFIAFVLLLCVVAQALQEPMLGELPDWTQFPQPILWLFNEGTGTLVNDLSGNGNSLTLFGPPSWVGGQYGPAIQCDGTGDYGETALPSGFVADMPITIVVSAKQTTSNLEGLVNIQAAAEDAGQILTLYLKGGNQARTSQASNAARDMATVATLDTNKWNQYICTHPGGAATGDIYVNGILANGTPIDLLTDWGTNVIQVGKGVSATYDFTGEIEYVLIFDFVLNPSQIAQLHIDPFPWFAEDVLDSYVPTAAAPSGQVIFINLSSMGYGVGGFGLVLIWSILRKLRNRK